MGSNPIVSVFISFHFNGANPISTLLACVALAAVTLLVAIYVSAQRYRLRILEIRLAAIKADLTVAENRPTLEHSEVLLTTSIDKYSSCFFTLRPHYIVAKRALRKYPGCRISINDTDWEGRDVKALTAWYDTKSYCTWNNTFTCHTVMTRKVPAPIAEPA